jgi:long-subunit fatty acid transport protein
MGFRVGINVAPLDWLEIGFDFDFFKYDVIDYQVTDIYVEDAGSLFNILKKPDGEAGFYDEKDFHNSYNVSLGFMFHVFRDESWAKKFSIMVGGQYDVAPFPTKSYALESPIPSSGGFGIGVRYVINDMWKIAFVFQSHFAEEIDIKDSITVPPTNVQATGMSQVMFLYVNLAFNSQDALRDEPTDAEEGVLIQPDAPVEVEPDEVEINDSSEKE